MSRKLTFLLVVVLCTASSAQEKPLPSFLAPKKDTTRSKQKTDQISAPNSLLLLEDIFGRLYDGAMLSENYQGSQYKLNSTRTDGQKYSEKFDYHNFSLSGGYGRRDKYQVNSSLYMTGEDLAGRNSYRNLNLNFIYLPGNAWQIYNRVTTTDYAQSAFKDNFSWNGSLLYLSRGQISMSDKKFQHFFFFRDILLEPGQLWFSFYPGYSYHKNDWSDFSELSKATYLPLAFGYGLSDLMNVRVNLSFDAEESSDDHFLYSNDPSGNEKIGTGIQKQRRENISSDVGLYLIPDRRILFESSVSFEQRQETNSTSNRYYSGSNEYYKSVDKRDRYTFQLRANYLSIHRALSSVDFRRSFYNGIYLRRAELKNQLHWIAFSKDYDDEHKWSLRDEFDLGLTDHINLSLNIEYDRIKKILENQNDNSSWNYSTGLTFYNLNFSGDELNDFDYFYGRIVQPKDYVATISWQQQHRTYFYQYNLKGVRLDVQTGLLSNMDISLYYNYQKNSFKYASGPFHDFGAGLRMNLLNHFRVLINASYAKSHSERSSNIYDHPTTNTYQMNLRIGAQAAF